MRNDVIKGIIGLAIGATAAVAIFKMAKQGKLDVVIDENILNEFLPRKEIVLNPNGEDFTVKKEPELLDERY